MDSTGIPIHELGDVRIACECCVRFEDKVLMQKRSADAKNFPGFWTFPGGHVDKGENVFQAALRETAEETGIDINPKLLKLSVHALNYHSDRKQVWAVFGFVANLEEFQEAESTDEGECRWFSKAELAELDNIFPPIKHYFEHIIADVPTMLYMSGEWEKSQLKELWSESETVG